MEIISGKKLRPRRCLLYGEHGLGKSTWAASAPKPIFLQCEDGLDDIGADRSPLLQSVAAVKEALTWVLDNEHDYKTLVIDTLDWLERILENQVVSDNGGVALNMIGGGFGKGRSQVMAHWEIVLELIKLIHLRRQMNIVLLAHAKIEKKEPPDADSYGSYEPALHEKISGVWQEWCDEVFFLCAKKHIAKKEEGFGRERGVAHTTGDRVIKTGESPAHASKNRLDDLPAEIPAPRENGFSHYTQYWPTQANPLAKGA